MENKAMKFVISNLRYITSQLIQRNKEFVLSGYVPELEPEIMDIMIKFEEVERLIPCDEGIKVYFH